MTEDKQKSCPILDDYLLPAPLTQLSLKLIGLLIAKINKVKKLQSVPVIKKMIKIKLLIFPALLFLVINLTSYFIVHTFYQSKLLDLKGHFDIEAEKNLNALKQVVGANLDVALSLQAFFYGSSFVSRDDFRNYSRVILSRHPEIQALNWLPQILYQNRSDYEKKMQKEGFEGFTILEKTADNRLIPARPKAVYYPLHYLEPFEKNKKAFALDSSSNLLSLKAINQVNATQQFAISSPLRLIQEQQAQLAILIFFPVYKEKLFVGLVELVLRMGDILEYIQKRFDLGKEVLIELYDVSEQMPMIIAADKKVNTGKAYFYSEKFWDIGGKKWKALFFPGPSFLSQYDSLMKELYIFQFLVPIIGLVMSSLLFFVMLQKNKAEENARQYQSSQLRFKQLINQTADTYFLFDMNGKILDVNQRGCEMLGYTREEFLELSIVDITTFTESKQGMLWNEVKLGNTVCFEWQHIHKDGRLIPVEDNINHFLLDNEPVFSALSRDITERIVNIQALHEARDNALRANGAKSDFLANMSHEIRTPMHGILSFARFGLKNIDTADKNKLQKYFDRINESGERLLFLLNDLLDLSKLEAGKMELDLKRNNLYRIVEACQAEQEGRINEQRLVVKTEGVEDDCFAIFDKTRIWQVMTNLLSNAIKFTPQGKAIDMSINKEILNERPALCFSITDEGIGIPVDELQQVFDKFIQSSKTKTKAGGTGLGLPICQEIINLHHGRIWAEQSALGGAVFKFIIPVEQNADKNTA